MQHALLGGTNSCAWLTRHYLNRGDCREYGCEDESGIGQEHLMQRIALVVIALVGFGASATAGRHGGGGGGSHSRSSGMSGTGSSSSSHSVRGYTTKRGTYVAPHRQTSSDHTQLNNYSTKGNYNSSTGKTGTKYATH